MMAQPDLLNTLKSGPRLRPPPPPGVRGVTGCPGCCCPDESRGESRDRPCVVALRRLPSPPPSAAVAVAPAALSELLSSEFGSANRWFCSDTLRRLR